MATSGIGSYPSAAEIQTQQIQNERQAASDAAARARDDELAVAAAALTIDHWEHANRVDIERLLIRLAERRHPDANRQRHWNLIRRALDDAQAGLWP